MSADVALGLLGRGGRWFLQRRSPGSRLLAGLWEFPGGKVEDGETPGEALLRELAEEIRWRPTAVVPLAPFSHRYPHGEVRIHPFLCAGPGHPLTDLAWGWFTPREMADLPLVAGSRPLALQLGGREAAP